MLLVCSVDYMDEKKNQFLDQALSLPHLNKLGWL